MENNFLIGLSKLKLNEFLLKKIIPSTPYPLV